MKHTECNKTSVSGFLLLQFSVQWALQILIFIILFLLYVGIVSGNLLIVAAVTLDHHLHSPMYFFLLNLSISDVGFVSVFMPKAMANSLMNMRYISYSGCVAQVLFFTFFISSDFAILTAMAFDRYVAICKPLQYEMIMNRGTCMRSITTIWIIVFLCSVLHTCSTFANTFCSHVVNQFFCEIPQLLLLASSDTYLIETWCVLVDVFIALGCFVFVVITYVYIFTAVRRIHSAEGRKKALSTCLPHLFVVTIFLSTLFIAYLRPSSDNVLNISIAMTVVYCVVPPLLNPIIYSMRNREIKNAMQKLLGF